jgi:DNA polymerase III alpha subunit
MYVELHAASAFSFLRASSLPEDLVARAANDHLSRRSASREIGKVLGIPVEEIDRLAGYMRRFEYVDPDDTLEQRLSRPASTGAIRGSRSSPGSSRRSRRTIGSAAARSG